MLDNRLAYNVIYNIDTSHFASRSPMGHFYKLILLNLLQTTFCIGIMPFNFAKPAGLQISSDNNFR